MQKLPAMHAAQPVSYTHLCNLIPRFYEVTGGRILIDGQDIQHVTLKSLREDIGIVQQDVLSLIHI